MAVTNKEVEHVARLARLGMTEEEKVLLTSQLSAIIEYAEILKKIDTTDVPPTPHAIPMKNVFRADEVKVCDNVDDILANAPAVEAHMFIVPKIMET